MLCAAFLDGANKGTNIDDLGILTTPGHTSIGAKYSGQEVTAAYSGNIDECCISNIIRTDEWIEFAYASDKGDAGTAGDEEEVPELVVLLIPIALAMPVIVKYMKKKKLRY